MCKIFMVVGAKDSTEYQKLLKSAAPIMSRVENDGIGFTVVKEDSKLFTQRWHKNEEAFLDPTKESVKVMGAMKGAIDGATDPTGIVTSLKGKVDWSKAKTSLMHTRMATCGKEFENVHPFVSNDHKTSLVHNGVITNHSEFKKLNSTCDSEVILTEYLRLDIANNPDKIAELVSGLEGYWAVGVTSVTKEGRRIIDVFRGTSTSFTGTYNYAATGGSATLFTTYADQLKGQLFCTKEDMLKDIINKMDWKHENKIYAVKHDYLIRFDAITGEVLMSDNFADRIVRVEKTYTSHKQQGAGGGSSSSTNATTCNTTRSNSSKNVASVDRGNALCNTARQYTDGDIDEYLEDSESQSNSKLFFNKEIDDAIQDVMSNGNNDGSESSDSRYFKEMSKDDIASLETFAELLDAEESSKLNDLPKELRLLVLHRLAATNDMV